jgi:hypothetical protein
LWEFGAPFGAMTQQTRFNVQANVNVNVS